MIERAETSSQTHKPLQQLNPGQHVLIQNGDGRARKRWGRSGMIVEVLPFRQYRVKYDGSGRLAVRNRQHLKAFVPPSTNVSAYPAAPTFLIPNDDIPPPVFASTPIRSEQDNSRNLTPPSWRTTAVPSPTPTNVAAPVLPAEPPVPVPDTPPTLHQPQHEALIHAPQSDTPDLSNTIPYDLTEYRDLRRGTRTRNPPIRLSPKLRGKTHLRE